MASSDSATCIYI